MGRWSAWALGALLASLVLAAPAQAAGLAPLSGTTDPIYVTAPPFDGRVFVVERGGGIRIFSGGVLRATPFLTVGNVDTTGERGLLSLAFPPDFASSRLFYVFTVAAGPDALDPGGQDGDVRVVEYRDPASSPNVAAPASARLVLRIRHPASNHNGGQLQFGPDGMLYVSVGDGGSTPQFAQNRQSLLGKILRIDPRAQGDGSAYGIPADNPFAGGARCPRTSGGPCPEVFAYGLRNPFRFALDRTTGDMVIGDVGQSTWEEVDFGARNGATNTLRGANLGWSRCEGFFEQGSTTQPCGLAGRRDPVFAYPHTGAAGASGCAIIGGYVVRDPTLGALAGRYLYGDLCRGDLRTLDPGVAGGDPRPAGLSVGGSLFSFGQDARGCVYVVADGTVYRVTKNAGGRAACQLPVPSP
jgi:glucose/arabinose dehydrogenase